jgi:hypothetical protein
MTDGTMDSMCGRIDCCNHKWTYVPFSHWLSRYGGIIWVLSKDLRQ